MSYTVLVCDDASYMREMIMDIVTQVGHEVVAQAENGVEAVEKYKEFKPDVVTMDIVMPDMSGVDALRKIREADPHARIIMCTAIGQKALIKQAEDAGAVGFVIKPFTASALVDALNAAL